MLIVDVKSEQHELKGQCELVAADLKKVQTILTITCYKEYLISLALKHKLTDEIVFNKQHICPGAIERILRKLIEINLFPANIAFNCEWEGLSEQSDLELWELLINRNALFFKNDNGTGSDDNMAGNTVSHSNAKYCPNKYSSEIVNIPPGNSQIPVSFTSEPDQEALAFPKDYCTEEIKMKKKIHMIPFKYVFVIINLFLTHSTYCKLSIGLTGNEVASSFYFAEFKQCQSLV